MKVSLHLTQNCNLRCTYCYGGEKSNIFMTEEIAQKAIDFILQETSDPYLALTFFGGEPLLKFTLIEKIIAIIKARNRGDIKIRYAINTNGTLLNDRIARVLIDNYFYLFLSLDGNESAQNSHRVFPNNEGSFFVVDRNIETFLKINPYLVTISVVTPENVMVLIDSVKYLIEKGVRLIMLTPDYTAAWDKRSFTILEKAYKKLAKLYIRLHRRGQKIFINSIDERIKTHTEQNRRKDICNIADSEFSIAPDGTIFPCIQFINAETLQTKQWAIGHVSDGWNETARQEIIDLSNELPQECSYCALNGRCFNFCSCLNVRTTGKVNDVSPLRCTHERMIFPIVDHIGNTLFKEKNKLFLQKFYNPHHSVLSVLEDGLFKRRAALLMLRAEKEA